MESAPIEALRTVPVAAVAPTGEPVELARVVEPPPAETDAAPVTMAAAALPKTASSLPLIGLMGLLGLVGSFVLSLKSKRAA
jgi:LPXTG-motif cell wall-anchored protein